MVLEALSHCRLGPLTLRAPGQFLEILVMAASNATSTESLSAVHQEILSATRPAAAAPGKSPGIVHIQNHLIRKIPSTKIRITQNTIAGIPNSSMLRSFMGRF